MAAACAATGNANAPVFTDGRLRPGITACGNRRRFTIAAAEAVAADMLRGAAVMAVAMAEDTAAAIIIRQARNFAATGSVNVRGIMERKHRLGMTA